MFLYSAYKTFMVGENITVIISNEIYLPNIYSWIHAYIFEVLYDFHQHVWGRLVMAAFSLWQFLIFIVLSLVQCDTITASWYKYKCLCYTG